MNLTERDAAIIWHPYTQMQTAKPPIAIVSGNGAEITTEDGSVYLDMISSWWVTLHGHANPDIAEQISRQLTVLEHVIFAGFTHEPAVRLAEMLLQILPDNQKRIFYSDNGSTAVEVALKMALQYWHNKGNPKKKILALRNGYHGDTFGAMAVGDRSVFTQAFHDLLFEVIFADVPVPGQEEAAVSAFAKIAADHNDIAAFIFEPLVQGTAGMIMYAPEPLDKMMAICREHQVITIADEVMTGFGRTGKILATDYLQNKPDIICLSKGLTGGTMPLGVTACTADIYNAFLSEDKTRALFHGHSYTANPIACTAAIASTSLLLKPECRAQIDAINTSYLAYYEKIKKHPRIADIRIRGTILAIELRTDEATSYFNNLRDYIYGFFLDRRILMRPLGNIIYLLPPYCTTQAQLNRVYDAISELLENL